MIEALEATALGDARGDPLGQRVGADRGCVATDVLSVREEFVGNRGCPA